MNRKLWIFGLSNSNDTRWWIEVLTFCSSESASDIQVPVVPHNCSCLCSNHIYSLVFSPVMSRNSTYMNHFQDSGSVGHSGVGAAGSCLNRGDSGSGNLWKLFGCSVTSCASVRGDTRPFVQTLFVAFSSTLGTQCTTHSVPSVLVHSSASARRTEFIDCLMVFKA